MTEENISDEMISKLRFEEIIRREIRPPSSTAFTILNLTFTLSFPRRRESITTDLGVLIARPVAMGPRLRGDDKYKIPIARKYAQKQSLNRLAKV